MKKLMIVMLAVLVIAGCERRVSNDEKVPTYEIRKEYLEKELDKLLDENFDEYTVIAQHEDVIKLHGVETVEKMSRLIWDSVNKTYHVFEYGCRDIERTGDKRYDWLYINGDNEYDLREYVEERYPYLDSKTTYRIIDTHSVPMGKPDLALAFSKDMLEDAWFLKELTYLTAACNHVYLLKMSEEIEAHPEYIDPYLLSVIYGLEDEYDPYQRGKDVFATDFINIGVSEDGFTKEEEELMIESVKDMIQILWDK